MPNPSDHPESETRLTPSRRAFIGSLGVAAATTLIPLHGLVTLARAAASGTAMPELTLGTFAGLVGERFTLQHGSMRAVTLTLVDVTDHGGVATLRHGALQPLDRSESFTALFSGPANRRLPQGTYAFHHAGIASFPLFIVPLATEAANQRYAATIQTIPGVSRAAGHTAGGAQ